jgi:hypothetical protein
MDGAYGNGLGVAIVDVDADGWLDVFVANDTTPNHLWMNGRDGTFEDRAMLLGVAVDETGQPKAGMGISVDDVDGDDDVDLLVGNLTGQTDSFYRREPGFFTDFTARSGLSVSTREYTRFGMGWADFDNDGCLDLYEANGRVVRDVKSWTDDPYAEPNMLLRGTCTGTFEPVQPQGGTAQLLSHASTGAAFGDVDGDGGVDVVVVNHGGPAYLLRNVAPGRGHWLSVRLVEKSGRDALGATLRLRAAGRAVRRDVRPAYSYCSSNDPRIHVGLGTETRATGAVVTWVDGAREAFGDLEGDRVVTLRRGGGQAVAP